MGRQNRYLCPFCGERFAEHQLHVNLRSQAQGGQNVRKAHLACAEKWMRVAKGPFRTRHIPMLGNREA